MIHVMLPVQYLRQPGQRLAEPEKRLALAVLQTVLYDYRVAAAERAEGRPRARQRQTYAQAMAYVTSDHRPSGSTRNGGNWYGAGAGTEVEHCLVREAR
jgi:hypothetical protein